MEHTTAYRSLSGNLYDTASECLEADRDHRIGSLTGALLEGYKQSRSKKERLTPRECQQFGEYLCGVVFSMVQDGLLFEKFVSEVRTLRILREEIELEKDREYDEAQRAWR